MAIAATDRGTVAADRLRYDLALDRARLSLLRALGAGDRPSLDAGIADLAYRMSRLPPGRCERLARSLGLDAMDVDLLWTTVAASHDPRCAAHAAALCGPEYLGGTSLALQVLASGLDVDQARALALRLNASHPLVRESLLMLRGEIPGRRTLYAPDRVAGFLAGKDDLDPELGPFGVILDARDDLVVSAEQQAIVDTLGQLLTDEPDSLVVLEGPGGVGRRTLIARAAAETGRVAICVDAAQVPHAGPALEHAIDALRREVLLRRTAVAVVANLDALVGGEIADRDRLRAVGRALGLVRGPVVVTSAVPGLELPSSRTPMRLRVPPPSVAARAELWRRRIGDTVAVEAIALRYQLGPGTIDAASRAATALARARGSIRPGERDVVDGVRVVIAERLGSLATRIEPHESWSDVVLQPDTQDQIRALIGRVRHAHQVLDGWGMRARLPRGTGVAALFSGPPGTGKTMVAGVIARDLDLELYQVDLSRVVSKWVGETEKQLAQIFDAAEAGHALLLFDEADALFAKRTEVKAAVDRYANLEVNYLLQRVESFGGVTILTTNMDTSIDPALKRRLAAHVVFWPPDEDERMLLWTKMIPTSVPRDGKLDFESLASEYPDMTGAHIRNAAVAATFLAASEQQPLRHVHLQRAARAEYRAMGRVLGKRGAE